MLSLRGTRPAALLENVSMTYHHATDAFMFTLVSNCSISALNVSLKLNSVGMYQVRLCKCALPRCISLCALEKIAKLSMLPCTYLLELCVIQKPASLKAVLCISMVLGGVGSAYAQRMILMPRNNLR